MNTRLLIFLGLVLVATGWFFVVSNDDDASPIQTVKRALQLDSSPLPDFTQYADVNAKKQAFFAYLQPVVAVNNQHILDDRARLAALANTSDEALSRADRRFLAGLVDRYEIDTSASSEDQRAELMVRLDTVPMSLALTQAAMESAWGTSRFAREGNNLFGQWCYQPGCGIVPKRRGEGQVHEVASFDDVDAAVASYLRNINSHRAYADLRAARADLRAANQPVTGNAMANHLLRYSERGLDYVEEIQSMIRVNKLAVLDGVRPASWPWIATREFAPRWFWTVGWFRYPRPSSTAEPRSLYSTWAKKAGGSR